MEVAAEMRRTTIDEVLDMAKFHKGALEKFFKTNRPQKSIIYGGKKYRLWSVRKYPNETSDYFNPNFYKRKNLLELVDIDDIPDRGTRKEIHLNNRIICELAYAIAETFGIYKTMYVAYADEELNYPLAIGLSKFDMGYYQRVFKKLIYVETTPVRFVHYVNKISTYQYISYFIIEKRRIYYLWDYFLFVWYIEGMMCINGLQGEGVTIILKQLISCYQLHVIGQSNVSLVRQKCLILLNIEVFT